MPLAVARASPERADEVAAPRLTHGRQRSEDSDRERGRRGEQRHARVAEKIWPVGVGEQRCAEQLAAPLREHDTRQTAERSEEESVDQQLRDQTSAAHTER